MNRLPSYQRAIADADGAPEVEGMGHVEWVPLEQVDIARKRRLVSCAQAICSVLSPGDTCCELAPAMSCSRGRYMEAAEAVLGVIEREAAAVN